LNAQPKPTEGEATNNEEVAQKKQEGEAEPSAKPSTSDNNASGEHSAATEPTNPTS